MSSGDKPMPMDEAIAHYAGRPAYMWRTDDAPKGTVYLVTAEYVGIRYVTMASRIESGHWIGNQSHEEVQGDVLAWMDKPEPYQALLDTEDK